MENKKRLGRYRWFCKYLPERKLIAATALFILLETCFNLMVPLVSITLIDNMQIGQSIVSSLILLIGLFLFQVIFSSIAMMFIMYVAELAVKNIRNSLWKKILKLPISYFDNIESGELSSRLINDILLIKNFVASDVATVLANMFSLVGSFILLFVIDWKMALLMILITPWTIIFISHISNKEYDVTVDSQRETASFLSNISRVVTEMRLVKVSTAEKVEEENGSKNIDELMRLGVKESKLFSIINPLTTSLQLLLMLVIFAYGAIRVTYNTLSAGELVAVMLYLFQISTPCVQLSMFMVKEKKFTGAIDRIRDIFEQEEEKKYCGNYSYSEGQTSEVGLCLDSVFFSYNRKSKETVLRNINLSVPKGTTVALVGISGVGKTTIFSLIERLYEPKSGNIYFEWVSIYNCDIDIWRKKIAYVAQDSPVMHGTILNNLTYGIANYNMSDVIKAVEDADLENFINELKDGYETIIGERGTTLSGGQRQKIAIARAMIRNPEILLLDEATAHLDSFSEKNIQRALNNLTKNRTTLIAAHRLSTITNVDKIVVIEKGEITAIGNHTSLLEQCSLYKKLVEQQMLI